MEWLVLGRIRGSMLTSEWPCMDRAERREAIHQLACMVEHLHLVDADWLDSLPPPVCQSELTGRGATVAAQAASGARSAADSLRGCRFVDDGILRTVVGFIEGHRQIFDTCTSGLIHGDLHFDNVLWRDERIVGILDFEYSRLAPLDLELDILLRFCAFPQLFVAEEREKAVNPGMFEEVRVWLAEDYPALFSAPCLRERLACYSLVYDLSMLVRHAPAQPVELLPDAHPYARLCTTVTALERHDSSVDP
jgi:hypothetical protein